MSTTLARKPDIRHEWHLVDASGQVLGRLAVRIATLLRGRHRPTYTPHVDTGDFVVVINADKVRLTGTKETKKIYHDYTGFRGGLKKRPAAAIRARRPERLIGDAVKGMLPRGTLMRHALRRLKVYAGDRHPHAAQQPRPLQPT
jgi:large subunit ribosomal protein L13